MTDTTLYDAAWLAAHYDTYGEREWTRLSKTRADRVSFAVHAHYLREFVRPGCRVLEIGAGPGRFTQVLADLGCRVVVGDISAVQLDLHRRHARELAFEDAVERRERLDVCDLSSLESGSFDSVVAYGGPLSYVFDRAHDALQECARVCRSGGHALASVMSLWGSSHAHLDAVLQIAPAINARIIETGDLSPIVWDGARQRCHLFRSGELRSLVQRSGLRVVAMSASSVLSLHWNDTLAGIDESSEQWHELIRLEIEACRQDGCLDMGTHLIVVATKD